MEPPRSFEHAPALSADVLPEAVRRAALELASYPGSGYVYDPALAADRARALRAALPEWARVYFAVKSNGFAPVLSHLAEAVDGFEAASLGEAVRTGFAVESVRPEAGGWSVQGPKTITARRVVLACHPRQAGPLLGGEAELVLGRAVSAPVAVVWLGGSGDDLPLPEGFGALVGPDVLWALLTPLLVLLGRTGLIALIFATASMALAACQTYGSPDGAKSPPVEEKSFLDDVRSPAPTEWA